MLGERHSPGTEAQFVNGKPGKKPQRCADGFLECPTESIPAGGPLSGSEGYADLPLCTPGTTAPSIHSTALLDAGIPVHTVAQRIGDDPTVLLKSFTERKRSKQADEKLSEAITGLAAGFLGVS